MRGLYADFIAGERAADGIGYRLASLLPSVRELKRRLYLDNGTGVFSREVFPELVDRQLYKLEKDEVGGVVLVYADMNGLKEINDKLGHTEGNVAIQSFADALLQSVRVVEREDGRHLDYVARHGGDEFGIISGADIDADGAGAMTALVPRRIEKAGGVSEREYPFAASTGAAFTDKPMKAGELIEAADETMYMVKESGYGASSSALWTPDGRTQFYTWVDGPEGLYLRQDGPLA